MSRMHKKRKKKITKTKQFHNTANAAYKYKPYSVAMMGNKHCIDFKRSLSKSYNVHHSQVKLNAASIM